MHQRWLEGNDIRLLENGEEFFPRVFACIANAREEVVIETFILFEDKVGLQLHQAMVTAARRGVQIDLLCQMVRGEVPDKAPLIVAGDFNDWRRRIDNVLEREIGLREVFITAYGESAKTFPARFPLLSLDRIYVRNASVHLPVVLPRKPWSHLSDHAPLAAEIHV